MRLDGLTIRQDSHNRPDSAFGQDLREKKPELLLFTRKEGRGVSRLFVPLKENSAALLRRFAKTSIDVFHENVDLFVIERGDGLFHFAAFVQRQNAHDDLKRLILRPDRD